MGADAHLVVVGGPRHLIEVARRRVDELEARWSRFRPDSEISELNRRAGQAVRVSADTVLLVERSIEAWGSTGGSFDPTVLGAMLRAGYHRSFDELDRPGAPSTSALVIGCTDIVVADGTVRLPAGSGFDAGGIGKGLAADLVAVETMRAGADGVCVNLGGDLRVSGSGPAGAAWTIALEHPRLDHPVALLGLSEGAVATSTTLRRRWVVDGTARHHLIDPATGEPSTTDLELATVIAGEAWLAEVLAKAVLLRGSDRAFDIVDPARVRALTVDHTGLVSTTLGFADVTGGIPLPPRLDLDR